MNDHRIQNSFPPSAELDSECSDLAAISLDGVPAVVGAGVELWTCDLTSGERTTRPIDVADAAPEDPVHNADGELVDDPEVNEDSTEWARRLISRMTVTDLDGRPVVITGGEVYDLALILGDDFHGGAVRIWDLATGRKIGKTLTGHDLGVTSLTTVPSERGPLVLSSCETGRLLAWTLAGGERVAEIQAGYNGAMAAAVVNGRPVAVTGGHDHFVQAWDVLSGAPLGGPLTGIAPVVWAIGITELDGRAVVLAGGQETTLRMWDLATGERIGAPLTGHPGPIDQIAFTRFGDRPLAVTRSRDGTARVWDLARGEQWGAPLTVPAGAISAMTTTEIDGTPVIVTGAADGTVHVWNLGRS
ncbi:hypothetical protein ABZV14_26845 [Streptosporangium canum]|uniref:WD40 repeat domain-containing protein n=1 Tax=Streptosporangium canum TaxID=324952 RepID=UPI0033A444B3